MRLPLLCLRILMMFFFAGLWCSPLSAATPDEYYQAGLTLYSQQNYPQAIQYLRAAAQLNPNHWQAYQLMGYCYYQTQDNVNAIGSFDKSIAVNPENLELKIFADNLRAQTAVAPNLPLAVPAGAAAIRPAAPKIPSAFKLNKWGQLHFGGIYASLGDLRTAATALDTLPTYYQHSVSCDDVGFLVGGAAGYALDPENIIGLSIDGAFFGGYKDNVVNGPITWIDTFTPTMVAIEAVYDHCFLMGSSRIQLGLGAGLYYTIMKISQTINNEILSSGTMAGIGFGGTLNLGWEMALAEQLSLNVYARGRFASTSNIKSDAQSKTGEDLGEVGLVVSSNNYLGTAPVSSIGANGIRWAKVDYTGGDAGLGFTFHY